MLGLVGDKAAADGDEGGDDGRIVSVVESAVFAVTMSVSTLGVAEESTPSTLVCSASCSASFATVGTGVVVEEGEGEAGEGP